MRALFLPSLMTALACGGLTLMMVPAEAQTSATKPAHATSRAASKGQSEEARHRDCLAFIERHGLSCDPWKQPTCGFDLGIARPLTCVAP